MLYIIKGVVICTGVLLLLAAYSSGNPLPARDPRSMQDSMCDRWRLDTNSEKYSAAQVFYGTIVFDDLLPSNRLNREMLRDQQYKLGLQAVCKMYHLFRLYDDIKECDDKNITFLSYKYVAQRAMESACRWVQIGFGNSGGVRNCTLEDIDAVCIEFQYDELYNTRTDINNLYRNKSGFVFTRNNSTLENWFNCTLSQNQEQLCSDAVHRIHEKIQSRFSG